MKLTKENIAEIAVMVFDGKTSAFCDCHFDDYFLFIWIMKNGLTHGSLVTYIGEE